MNSNDKSRKPEREALQELNGGNIELVYRLYYAVMLCFFLRYLPTNFYAEEFADDLFMKLDAIARRNKDNSDKHFKTTGHLLGWLKKTAWLNILQEYRRLKTRRGKTERSIVPIDDDSDEYVADDGDLSDRKLAIDTFYDMGLDGCLEDMLPHHKEVIVCIFIKGYTLKATAEYLKVNVKTVADWLMKAVKFILEKISGKIGLDVSKPVLRFRKDLTKKSDKNDRKKGDG